MPYPVPFLIFLQFLLHEMAAGDARLRFFLPVDGLRREALESYRPREHAVLRMLFYMKPGELWQGPGDPDGVRWSGYRTFTGGSFRYAQARAYVGRLERGDAEGGAGPAARISWVDAGLLDNIPSCVPGAAIPDHLPVMELVCWVGGETKITPRYAPPAENFSPSAVVDRDPLAPGKEGDFGAVFMDAAGFKRLQRGVDISGEAGVTPVKAAAVGRVALVSRDGAKKASALEPDGITVTADFPPGRPDKGSALREYGNCVYVAHPDGSSVRYANLAAIDVEVGQGVLPGTRIGTMGPPAGGPGWAHIEVRLGDPLDDADSLPVNPWEFFDRVGATAGEKGRGV